MHLLLTDRLTCPRCGPEFGLILLSDRMVDRRVLEGTLGCANCRDGFPVREGFGDLRTPPRGDLPAGRAGELEADGNEGVERIMALLGVAEGPGTLVLVGGEARRAAALAERIPGVEIVGVDADLARWPEVPRVSRMVSRPGLPLFSRSMRGVVLDGGLGLAWVEEAARVVSPLARVVVTESKDGTSSALEQAGLQILAQEAGTVVAARS